MPPPDDVRCSPGAHDYVCIAPERGPMLAKSGESVLLFFCRKCGHERILSLTALGIAFDK